MTRRQAVVLAAATWALGGSMALGLATVHAVPGTGVSVDAGPLYEDSPGWSCVDDGNRVCGPGNSNGVPAGRYDVDGLLVDAWPVDGLA